MQKKKRTRSNARHNSHRSGFWMDFTHLVLCIGVVVVSVIIFLNPVQFAKLFPLCFFLAGCMQLLHGIPKIHLYRQRKRVQERGLLYSGGSLCVLGIFFLGLAAASLVTTWGV